MGKIVKLLTAVSVLGLLVGCGSDSSSSGGGAPSPKVTCSDTDYIAGTTTCGTVSGIKFAFIPSGTFLMGSAASDITQAFIDEKPQHSVTLTKDFFIGVTEVTQGQWKAIMGNNPSTNQAGDNYPVETISWNDAHDFINALNAAEPNITINGVQYKYALPTEAQWEYAARAGTQTRYYFGDNGTDYAFEMYYFGSSNATNIIDDYAWWSGNSGGSTHEVAQLLPNAWGLYDITGNVLEFAEDRFDNTIKNSYNNPLYLVDDPLINTGTSLVARGGHFASYVGGAFPARYLRNAYRTSFADPNRADTVMGVRLALVSDR